MKSIRINLFNFMVNLERDDWFFSFDILEVGFWKIRGSLLGFAIDGGGGFCIDILFWDSYGRWKPE